jgi:hypothetical protein
MWISYDGFTFARKVFLNVFPMKKKKFVAGILMGLLFNNMVASFPLAKAAGTGSVVINEVAWAGSMDATTDEWIELYNTTAQAIDLTGWTINDDQGSSIYTLTGQIAAHGYYVIEKTENAVKPLLANAIAPLSLANTGDALVLYDQNSQVVDAVNSTGGMWFAGDSTTKATMERKSVSGSGDDAANWATSTGAGSVATASGTSLIVGTPGLVNSQSAGSVVPSSATLNMALSSTTPFIGDVLTVNIDVANVTQLFSYGLELHYDPMVLSFQSVTAGTFLSQGSSTSFQAGLEDGVAGTLLMAEAQTGLLKTGVSGNGNLAVVQFQVIGASNGASNLTFDASSFLADPQNDVSVSWGSAQFTSSALQANPVTNLQAVAGAQRYALQVTWDASVSGADAYKVYRKDPSGQWVLLGQVAGNSPLSFVDDDTVVLGGKIVPFHTYDYRVIAVKNGIDSVPVETSVQETRGLKADNNRSDRVDGRDLENLARHFGETSSDSNFYKLADTTYDGQIDGSDLIDLGIDFAQVYG